MPTAPRRVLSPALLAGLLVALALPTAPPAVAKDDARLEREEAKAKEKIADLWAELAEALVEKGLREPATDALAALRRVQPGRTGLEDLAARVEALEAGKEPDAAATRLVEKAQKDAAKAYDKLAKLFDDGPDDGRAAGYLLEALELEPSKSRLAKVADLARKDLLLLKSPRHPLVAYVSLPRAWKPGVEYPVLVSVEGAGCNFKGNASGFRSARGSRDWITVSPHALSCTNELDPAKYPAYGADLLETWNGNRVTFDLEGLLAILDLVRERFGGSEKVAITGFSGGGNLCYGLLLQHPERVSVAAPACANFQPGLAQGAPQAAEGGPPVHLMTGEKDPHRFLTHGTTPPGIEEQTDWAEKALAEHGFQHVKRTMLPGVGHSSLAKEVWDFVDEALGTK
jgi:pimeloyl-ACP methyl ester carboxylesterase